MPSSETRYDNLLVRREGHVAVVTFNRPAKANALDHAHLADIEAAALAFREDVETRAVVFTGAGKHFSSGADLDGGGPVPSSLLERRRLARIGERATLAVFDMDQITVAAWNGAAMGGGAVLAARLAGPARAKRLAVGGERIAAQELLAWGVLDALVPPGELLPEALRWAGRYAAKPPIPAQMIKRSVNAIVSAQDNAVMHMDVDQNILSSMTADRAAAVAAYRDKTEPTFTGN